MLPAWALNADEIVLAPMFFLFGIQGRVEKKSKND